ncbi:MAG: DUF4112 domain-containing protein [Caulobacteraceae bacterium]|nr:DUF4112 domain-containing protein [Caulobacteraceae bacterium]
MSLRTPPSDADLRDIRRGVDRIGRLSDSLVRIGPFSLGVDGILSWIPGVGEIYSAGAAAYLLGQGLRARVPVGVLAVAAALMGSRTVITAIPFAGPAAAYLLTMHKWSARLIVEAIDRKLARSGASNGAPSREPLWRSRGAPVATT